MLVDAAHDNRRQLGQLMVDEGFLTVEQLSQALAQQGLTGRPLGAIMVELGFVSAGAVGNALAEQHGGLLKTEFGISAGLHALPGGAVRSTAAAPAADPAARVQALESQLQAALSERDRFVARIKELEAAQSQGESPASEPPVGWSDLLLTPSRDGYALVEFPGPAPPLGTVVSIDGIGFVVRRIGPSPLPGSGLRCAFLERV